LVRSSLVHRWWTVFARGPEQLQLETTHDIIFDVTMQSPAAFCCGP